VNDRARRVYRHLFHPRSIAVVGASNDPRKPGGRLVLNLKRNAYAGRLWAVNPRGRVLDLETVPSIAELPEAPELALIVIPGPAVRSALGELAARGAGSAIVMSAGFGEKDAAGREEEQRLRAIADAAGMAVIGPNCSGFLTPTYAGKFAGILTRPRAGTIDLVTGSGALMDFVVEQAATRGVAFSNAVNVGNSMQMGIEDILELLDENFGPDSARIQMLYIERLDKPGKLLRHARSLTRRGCTLVAIKSGITQAGMRAASSHTGAMATPDTAVEALFRKAGIIRVTSREEMLDVGCALLAARGPVPGRRACIVSSAGGPGVLLADELTRHGFELPPLSERSRDRLRAVLPAEASLANPLDCLPSKDGEKTALILRVLQEEEHTRLDVIVTIDGHSGIVDEEPILEATLRAAETGPIPVVPVFSAPTSSAAALERFKSRGGVFFTDEVMAGRALGRILKRPILWDEPQPPAGYDRGAVANALGDARGPLAPDATAAVLAAAGFSLPAQAVVSGARQAAEAAARIGFPVAMKVAGPLHKSEADGVRLGLRDPAEAATAFAHLSALPGATGVLVQAMVTGTELIVGAAEEPGFGHVILFGLGGIYTEVLRETAFGLAPLAHGESLDLIRGTRLLPVLEGARGRPAVSLVHLADCITRLSLLVRDFPRIREVDLNPLTGTGDRLQVVDARLILAG
jgi:acyl-CoA synthetase (NDP forming)